VSIVARMRPNPEQVVVLAEPAFYRNSQEVAYQSALELLHKLFGRDLGLLKNSPQGTNS
jgi:hypothetical protein